MTREAFISWATARGWKQDRFGHLQRSIGPDPGAGQYRMKLSRLAARYETKSEYGWVRLRSAYYKDLSLTADGKLAGMSSAGCGMPPRVSGGAKLDSLIRSGELQSALNTQHHKETA